MGGYLGGLGDGPPKTFEVGDSPCIRDLSTQYFEKSCYRMRGKLTKKGVKEEFFCSEIGQEKGYT